MARVYCKCPVCGRRGYQRIILRYNKPYMEIVHQRSAGFTTHGLGFVRTTEQVAKEWGMKPETLKEAGF